MGDVDYLAARLRGRRSGIFEGARLRGLCGLPSPAALAGELFPGEEVAGAAGIQAALAGRFLAEASWIASMLGGRSAAYADWQAARFALENVKTALRGMGAPGGMGAAAPAPLPPPWEACGPELASAASPDDLVLLLPPGLFRSSLSRVLADFPGGNLFLLEAALHRDYLAEALRLAGRPAGPGAAEVVELCAEEARAFNLLTAARGALFHGLGPRELAALRVPLPGEGERARRPAALPASAGEISGLEAEAWQRWLRLARRTMAAGSAAAATAAGYLALRRVEAANLSSVAEGLRLGAEPGRLFGRLIPRAEATHV